MYASSSKHGIVEATGRNCFQNVPESSENQIVPEIFKITSRSSQKRSNWHPEAFKVRVFGPSGPKVRFLTIPGRFWGDFGGVLGSKILPKSIKIGPKGQSNFDPFSDIRFCRFSIRFCFKIGVRNLYFSARNRKACFRKNLVFP